MAKGAACFRLSDTGKRLLERLAKHHGISQASVLEMLIRREARSEGFAAPTTDEGSPEAEEPFSVSGSDPPRIFSIGYQERSPESLIAELRVATVTKLVDVRETPWSHRAAFSRKNLEKSLADAGIQYVHAKFAGNPREFRRSAASHDDCLATYRSYLQGNAAVLDQFSEVIEASSGAAIALFCYERHPGDCHRSILIDEWMRHTERNDVRIEHLATEGARRFSAIP
jgi:hypothetical protein